MNKIIVVGHPQSGWERLYELLLDCGMAQALPSRREGFRPEQIGAMLLKAHGVLPVQQVRSADELQQIAVAPVWQGLALDLVLANMEQPLWGWADVQAVYLLDYWKAQDPQTMFVLVYDTPQTALTRHAVEHLEADPEALQAKVKAWVAYNSALLSFHLRNPERSLLVHADQVQASATHYVQQLSARMDAPLQLPGAAQGRLNNSVTADGVLDGVQPVLQTETAEVDIVHADTHAAAQPALQGNALAQWLAQQLLQEHPEAQELYAQLQAAASMPLRVQQQGTALLAGHDLQQQHYQAWAAFVAQQTAMQQSAARLVQLSTTLQDRQQQLQNSEQENALLLAQLHQVQEALESHYQQSQQQAKQLAELPKLQADLKSAQEKAAKLQQTEAQLKKELQQVNAKPASTELQEENDLLLTQLHKVQEELERYYLENRQLKAGGAKLHFQSKPTYYGAAERVKQQLSYRLGATMIAQSRSVGGWLRMPFALNAEFKRFKQDQTARANQKLPPIAQYRDAHEAERVKQHLSYRLGARMIANSKTLGGWVAMPWALLGEAQAFRKERR
ncbi:chromosome partitioning protein ParA [Comamonas aquatica]|uniref:chromosome partitioning protein ParA n=1 Tax=Comamonas aquatica TaxID=225991 RepID=UPI002448295F|nr:chromosome partitioning protein ParA [Comamonas aquatica]MDH1765983.1 chromosome partitioning protein ParA [Comamonas aquatica]